MDKDFPQNLKFFRLFKKFPAFYVTRKFVTICTWVHHLFLSWATLIRFTPFSVFLRSILLLLSYRCPCLPMGFFPSIFLHQKLVCVILLPHTLSHAPPITSYSLWLPQYWNRSKINEILQLPVTSFMLDHHIFLSNLFSDTLSPCSSLSFRDQF